MQQTAYSAYTILFQDLLNSTVIIIIYAVGGYVSLIRSTLIV